MIVIKCGSQTSSLFSPCHLVVTLTDGVTINLSNWRLLGSWMHVCLGKDFICSCKKITDSTLQKTPIKKVGLHIFLLENFIQWKFVCILMYMFFKNFILSTVDWSIVSCFKHVFCLTSERSRLRSREDTETSLWFSQEKHLMWKSVKSKGHDYPWWLLMKKEANKSSKMHYVILMIWFQQHKCITTQKNKKQKQKTKKSKSSSKEKCSESFILCTCPDSTFVKWKLLYNFINILKCVSFIINRVKFYKYKNKCNIIVRWITNNNYFTLFTS